MLFNLTKIIDVLNNVMRINIISRMNKKIKKKLVLHHVNNLMEIIKLMKKQNNVLKLKKIRKKTVI